MSINEEREVPFEYTSKGININGKLYSLEEITENIRMKEIEEKDLVVLHIEWGFSRNFDGAYEKRAIKREDANKFKKDFTGVRVNFGEIAGKHSEIYGTLEEDEIVINSDPKEVVAFLKKHPSGHNFNHSFIYTIRDQILDGEFEYNLEDFDNILGI